MLNVYKQFYKSLYIILISPVRQKWYTIKVTPHKACAQDVPSGGLCAVLPIIKNNEIIYQKASKKGYDNEAVIFSNS